MWRLYFPSPRTSVPYHGFEGMDMLVEQVQAINTYTCWLHVHSHDFYSPAHTHPLARGYQLDIC
jgi:hypothetical protein